MVRLPPRVARVVVPLSGLRLADQTMLLLPESRISGFAAVPRTQLPDSGRAEVAQPGNTASIEHGMLCTIRARPVVGEEL